MNWYQQTKQADIDWRALGKGTGIGAGLGLGLMTLLHNPDGSTQQMPPSQQSSEKAREPSPQEEVIEEKRYEENPDDFFVARVIFSEAANVSDKERELVASVIKNRIGHKGFDLGKLESMSDVVNQQNAFEAIGDPDNMNWERSKSPQFMGGKERHAWDHSLSLASGNFEPLKGPSGRPLVYYHDKSIGMPKSWTNRYWRAVKEIETQHFIFYSIVPAGEK